MFDILDFWAGFLLGAIVGASLMGYLASRAVLSVLREIRGPDKEKKK